MQAAFDAADKSSDGKLSVSEVYKMMRHLGVQIHPRQMKEVFDEFDTNENFRISLREFVKLYWWCKDAH